MILQENSAVAENATLINCLLEPGATLGAGSVACHTHLTHGLRLGKGCFVSGVLSEDTKVMHCGFTENLHDLEMQFPP